ncbi:MAG: XRE family transcriptional regulator [Anaerolineae bacterium]
MEAHILRTIDPQSLGRRLQQARQARGLTQQAAADHLGVARTTVTAIEKGERGIRPSELVRLAELYGRAVGEFTRQGEPSEAFAVQLRAALPPDAPADDELSACLLEFQRLAEDYLSLEHLCRAPFSREYPPPRLIGRTDPEIAAEDLAVSERNRLGLGDGPILNLREMLENDVGLRIFYMDLPFRVAAIYGYTERLGGCIAVNRNHPEERRRLSTAHEYGHFLTQRFRAEITLLGRYVRRPDHERLAEAFARAFLMPAAGLRRRYNELDRNREGYITPGDLLTLAHLYFVSLEALAQRLEELKLLAAGTWDRLEQAGFAVRETQAPLESPQYPVSSQLLPARYLYLAVEAFERGDLSEGQFARFLRVDRLEARSIAEELRSRTVVSDAGNIGVLSLDLGRALSAEGE